MKIIRKFSSCLVYFFLLASKDLLRILVLPFPDIFFPDTDCNHIAHYWDSLSALAILHQCDWKRAVR